MKELKNLKKAIRELNAPFEVDGESFESGFEFMMREEDGRLEIFDANELYNIDYPEEMAWLMRDAALEFGFDCDISAPNDSVHEKLEKAVKKDFGKNAYLEWYDSVIMCVAL